MFEKSDLLVLEAFSMTSAESVVIKIVPFIQQIFIDMEVENLQKVKRIAGAQQLVCYGRIAGSMYYGLVTQPAGVSLARYALLSH